MSIDKAYKAFSGGNPTNNLILIGAIFFFLWYFVFRNVNPINKSKNLSDNSNNDNYWSSDYYKQFSKIPVGSIVKNYNALTDWVNRYNGGLMSSPTLPEYISLFKEIRSKYELSKISERFKNMTTKDLLTDLTGKLSGIIASIETGGDNKDTLNTILNYCKNLPKFYTK